MSNDPIGELIELLDSCGTDIRFGLRAQGHIPTIQRMLAAGESWGAIGKEIGWCPATAEKWFCRFACADSGCETIQHDV